MGLTVDFLIKHVRPADDEAFVLMCSRDGELWAYLRHELHMSDAEIEAVFRGWAIAIDAGLNDGSAIALAQAISQARWAELYPTQHSTILFLTAALLREMSHAAGEHPNATFEFDPAEHIPFAVTIHRNGSVPDIVDNADGVEVASDADGNAVHYGGLL